MFAPSYGLILLLIVLILILNLTSFILLKKGENFVNPKRTVLFIFFVALFIRFTISSFFPFGSGYDIKSFYDAGKSFYIRKDIYNTMAFRHYYSFFPTFAILSSYLINLEDKTALPYLFTEKIPIIIFDSLIAVLIYKITKSKISALVYSVSPIPIVISSVLGQFDAIVLFFIILSLYLFTTKKSSWGLLSLGVAVVFKPWALIFSLILLPRIKNYFRVLIILIPLIIVLFYYYSFIPNASLVNMFIGIILYNSVLGWWGPGALFRLFHSNTIFFVIGFATKLVSVVVIFLLGRLKNLNIFLLAKWVILTINVISFGFSVHYLLWIFPFALITKDKLTKSYMLVCGGFIILVGLIGGSNYNFNTPYIPEILTIILSQILWLFFVLWFAIEIRQEIRKYVLSY